jgi:phosphopantothenoylcysteine decarboxylase/phosphopantothenate--cysteine ligase
MQDVIISFWLAFLSSNCPVFVAPAMDLEMFKNSLNQDNIKKLKDNSTDVLPVGTGSLQVV